MLLVSNCIYLYLLGSIEIKNLFFKCVLTKTGSGNSEGYKSLESIRQQHTKVSHSKPFKIGLKYSGIPVPPV